MKKYLIFATLAIGIVIGASALSVLAANWTAPTATPPLNNVDAPINVGASTQTKAGSLGVVNLLVAGNSTTTGYTILKGGSAGNPNGWKTAFPWTDGKNYLRGNTVVDSLIATNGLDPACPNSTWGCGVHANDVWANYSIRTNQLCLGGGNGNGSTIGDCRSAWPSGGTSGVSSVIGGWGVYPTSPTAGAVTVSLSNGAWQQRINGACGTGQAIKSVNADGSVTCVNMTMPSCIWGNLTYSVNAVCCNGVRSVPAACTSVYACTPTGWVGTGSGTAQYGCGV